MYDYVKHFNFDGLCQTGKAKIFGQILPVLPLQFFWYFSGLQGLKSLEASETFLDMPYHKVLSFPFATPLCY